MPAMVRHLHRGRRIGSGARLNGKRAMFRGRHPAGRDERLQEQSARDRENSQRTLHPRPINRIAAWFHPLWDQDSGRRRFIPGLLIARAHSADGKGGRSALLLERPVDGRG